MRTYGAPAQPVSLEVRVPSRARTHATHEGLALGHQCRRCRPVAASAATAATYRPPCRRPASSPLRPPAAASRPAPLAVPPATPRTRGTPARRLRPRVARAKRTRRKTRTCARPDEDEDEDERDLPTAPINDGISLLLQGDWDANLVCRILTVPRSACSSRTSSRQSTSSCRC